jgi:hypothetical protein
MAGRMGGTERRRQRQSRRRRHQHQGRLLARRSQYAQKDKVKSKDESTVKGFWPPASSPQSDAAAAIDP